MKNRRKLRNLLIDPPIQGRFAAYTLLIVLAFALAVGLFARVFLDNLMRIVVVGSSDPEWIGSLVREQLKVFFVSLAVMFVLFLLVALAYIIVHTHRIAGAKYAIVRYISTRLQEFDFSSELILRDDDYLTDVARELNVLAEKLRSRLESP